MSTTSRLWSKEELGAVKTDRWLATILMNVTTLSEEEVAAYPCEQVRNYNCTWEDNCQELVRVKATDVRMLKRFLEAEYTRLPDQIYQVITQYRPVTLK